MADFQYLFQLPIKENGVFCHQSLVARMVSGKEKCKSSHSESLLSSCKFNFALDFQGPKGCLDQILC